MPQTKRKVVAGFRRAQILTAARERFARRGVAGTTVSDIARAARVAKGTVYLYYRSKDEILRQVLWGDLAAWGDDALPAIRDAGTIEERLHRFLTVTLEFFDCKRDFVEHCQLELGAEMRRKVRAHVGDAFAAQVDAWRAVLGQAAARGAVAIADMDGAARGIVSFAHGLALHRMRGWCEGSIATVADQATALLWQGLATR